ncbi:MAG: type VII toxin-antitoxin system MntA family adenylyltransferase antitoxin [Chloroflexota bacterium]
MAWNQQIASRVEGVLARFPELKLVYLFGSQAGGRTGPLSDYDFGVLVDDVPDIPSLRARLAHELGCALGTDRIDVVILNRAPIELEYAVIAQGRPIYQRDEATRVEYEARVMGRYGDYLPVLRAQRNDISRGGEHAARVQRYREALRRTERKIGQIRAAHGERSR